MSTHLLKTEWLKIKKYRAFWWMTGIVALTYPGINYIFYQIYNELLTKGNDQAAMVLKMLIGNPFAFPEVWHTVAYASSIFVIIPAIVVIMFITNEYTYKTHRQNIIDGWSRNQFMTSKMIDVLIISTLITLLYVLVALIVGYVNIKESNGEVWSQTKYIWLFFLQTFSQLSLAFLIAFLTRKAFIALGIFVFYKIILEKIMVAYGAYKLNDIGRFLPFEISNRTIPVPAFVGRFGEDKYKAAMNAMTEHVIYTIILIVITWGLCFWLNKRRDL
jgi:ABC-2 type transport system permease protein